MKNEFKELGAILRRGPRLKDDGSSLNSAVRKAMAEHQRLLKIGLARIKRLGGRYPNKLAGKRTTKLIDGTIITTWINPFGLAPTLKARVILPDLDTIIEEESFFVRGLICLPIATECGDNGFLPSGECAPSWNSCYPDGNQPLQHQFAPTDPETGTLLEAVNGTEYSSVPSYSDLMGPQYGNCDWISLDRSTEEGVTDFDVLSWSSNAARYATIPTEAEVIYYRGDELTGLPVGADYTAITFLGAAIADFGGTDYLVAAVMHAVSGRETYSALTWPSEWGLVPHKCLGEAQSVYHGHAPVRFWARSLNKDGYENNDLYHEINNPLGWRDLGNVECQSFTPTGYRRAFVYPRVLAGVAFQSESDGSSIKACWCCVDEFTDPGASPLAKNVFHITGYQEATVSLSGAAQSSSVLNDEGGRSISQSETWCSSTNTPLAGFDCNAGDLHPEWGPCAPNIKTVSGGKSQDWGEISGNNKSYEPYVIAVDYSRETGALVKATLTNEVFSSDSLGDNSAWYTEEETLEYWCDPLEPPNNLDGLGRVFDEAAEKDYKSISGRLEVFTIEIDGPTPFSIAYNSFSDGSHTLTYAQFANHVESGEEKWCEPGDGEPGYWAQPTITSVGGSRLEESTETEDIRIHDATALNTTILDLDLRTSSATYIEVYREKYTGQLTTTTGLIVDSDVSGRVVRTNIARDGDKMRGVVVDHGEETELFNASTGSDTSTVVIDQPSGGPNWPVITQCDSSTENNTDNGLVGFPFVDRTGIAGFFNVDAYRLPASDTWKLEGIRTDYGAVDEQWNYLVSIRAEVVGPDGDVYRADDFGEIMWWNYLTGQDATTYFGLENLTEPRLSSVGLI